MSTNELGVAAELASMGSNARVEADRLLLLGAADTIRRLLLDRDEWRTQHENAIASWQADLRAVNAAPRNVFAAERDTLCADLATLKELLRESNDRETGEDSKPLHDEGCEALGSWPHAEDECDCALGAWRARVAKALGKESGT